MSHFVSRAAEKLRSQKLLAGKVSGFIHSNPHSKDPQRDPYYKNSQQVRLAIATDNEGELIQSALALLEQIYQPGYRYMKAGIMLSELTSGQHRQADLFSPVLTKVAHDPLMEVLDTINRKMGKGAMRYASEGYGGNWQMKQNRKSPNYTTQAGIGCGSVGGQILGWSAVLSNDGSRGGTEIPAPIYRNV